jgi:hypothetical protein
MQKRNIWTWAFYITSPAWVSSPFALRCITSRKIVEDNGDMAFLAQTKGTFHGCQKLNKNHRLFNRYPAQELLWKL